jgi:hypothetical protein
MSHTPTNSRYVSTLCSDEATTSGLGELHRSPCPAIRPSRLGASRAATASADPRLARILLRWRERLCGRRLQDVVPCVVDEGLPDLSGMRTPRYGRAMSSSIHQANAYRLTVGAASRPAG